MSNEAAEKSNSSRGRNRPRQGSNKDSLPIYRRSTSHFQPAERDRGADCFKDGQVQLQIAGTRAYATVSCTKESPVRVGLDWSRIGNRRLHCFCECPRFSNGKTCRHIWAALLAVEEEEGDNRPAGKQRLGVRKDRAANWKDLGVSEPRKKSRRRSSGGRRSAAVDPWRAHLSELRDKLEESEEGKSERRDRRIFFLVNTAASADAGGLVLDLFEQGASGDGKPGKPRRAAVDPAELVPVLLPTAEESRERDDEEKSRDEEDSATQAEGGAEGREPADGPDPEILLLVGEQTAKTPPRKRGKGGSTPKRPVLRRLHLPPELYPRILPRLCEEELLGWWNGRSQNDLHPLWWDAGTAWHLSLHLEVEPMGAAKLRGGLEREGESASLKDPVLILLPDPPPEDGAGAGFVVFAESIGKLELDSRRDLPWLELLRQVDEIEIPQRDVEEALTELLELPALPRFVIPGELELVDDSSPLEPHLRLAQPTVATTGEEAPYVADLSFNYGGLNVGVEDLRSAIVDWDQGTLLRRDLDGEHASLVHLLELGFRGIPGTEGNVQVLALPADELPLVLEPLLSEGWAVEVHGNSVRSPSPPSLKVESGIDWFDLSGEVDFAGDRMDLRKILEAVQRGDHFVDLEDGSRGLVPASWIDTYAELAELATDSTDEGLRFLPSQALIVDALLSAMPPADVDSSFAKLREKLGSFERIKPKKEPRSFQGELRAYQRRGLGWLDFLREFGLGGVLADDMGLGKTVQVLALFQAHRTPSKTTKRPFLVVAPRSVVYNWIKEAAFFTPKLKAVEYLGPGRKELREKLDDFDLVVTTYGTMRKDIGVLSTVEFDTVVLDEAQAIKNSSSQTAKASRLLDARHRLALTGTPIENHLGDLGSIFEFLNPGLLGRLPRLEALMGNRAPSKKELEVLSRDMRPFILRRTKEQVLTDLPPKTEQILWCDMTTEQQKLYDKMRAAYQVSLLEQVETKGVSSSAIQVLEALLRLRQIACHPALVKEDWEEAGSAKMESLLEQASEVLEEGHKLLVFSQFTKLLGLARKEFDHRSIPYAYLDGQTRNREEVVERFQNDPECNLFLISLKAGGVGLNLTAAGYVFLLDPWWNPAVEAQAIDRTHRIGQTQPVFAYRLIARGTVEEKILDLQRSKRKLAESILDAEGQALKDLTADDLRMLLS